MNPRQRLPQPAVGRARCLAGVIGLHLLDGTGPFLFRSLYV